MRMLPFTFRSIEELELGPKWAAVFEERWPHYREWFLREGEEARPSYATSARMLRAHMPELMDAYERVVELAGGGDLAARMLSLYRPPPYLAACSQGVWSGDGGPMLVRNYDYAPSRMEGIIWSTRLGERRVIGMSDCLWGLLDGMNDAGLAVSLTFGGRRVLGDGFGIPLVVRYLLETCDDVASAREALARLPYALAHNLTVVDTAGEVLTAYLSPDREPFFRSVPAATNHQGMVEWPEQARATRTIERERCIVDLLARSRHDRCVVRGVVPAVSAVQHGVRQRLRDALHGGLSRRRRGRRLPVAHLHLAAEFRCIHEGRARRGARGTDLRPSLAPLRIARHRKSDSIVLRDCRCSRSSPKQGKRSPSQPYGARTARGDAGGKRRSDAVALLRFETLVTGSNLSFQRTRWELRLLASLGGVIGARR